MERAGSVQKHSKRLPAHEGNLKHTGFIKGSKGDPYFDIFCHSYKF
jgi:hypothetical protein